MNLLRGRFSAVLTLCCVAMATMALYAADRGPSTPEERAQALRYTQELETNPLGPNAESERRWLTNWLIEVPDISVPICTAFFPRLPKPGKKDSTVVFSQMMFAGAAFIIQHPDQKDNKVAIYQAEVEGALRAYESLLKTEAKDRDPGTDAVLKMRDDGTLAVYVQQQATSGCGR